MKKALMFGATAVISAAAGAVGGYMFAVKRLNARYNEQMEEEIARTRVFNDQKKFKTPQEAVEELIAKRDAMEAVMEETEVSTENLERIVKHLRYDQVKNGVAPEAKDHRNIFDVGPSSGEDETFAAEVEARDHTKPYIISDEESMTNEPGHDQITLTWYEGDSVLADDKDEPVEKMQRTIGLENLRFGHRSNDPSIVYIRNERLTADFTVLRHTGKYSVEVAGFSEEAG